MIIARAVHIACDHCHKGNCIALTGSQLDRG